MDEANFDNLLKRLQIHPVIFDRDLPKFTLRDLEIMTRAQLSRLALEMLKLSQWGPGSYNLTPELYDLIEYLDRIVSIPEDRSLEKYLHMTASLVCLTQFQGFPLDKVLPEKFERLKKHLERIIGPSPLRGIEQGKLYWDSMKTEPSLQIATPLAYLLLEGVIRRKLTEFISLEGKIVKEFEILKAKREKGKVGSKVKFSPGYQPKIQCERIKYHPEERKEINRIDDELRLLKQETKSLSLKEKLSYLDEVQGLFDEIQDWRWQLLHGILTASWHSVTVLLLTYIILLEG